jgi:hypothetical protein
MLLIHVIRSSTVFDLRAQAYMDNVVMFIGIMAFILRHQHLFCIAFSLPCSPSFEIEILVSSESYFSNKPSSSIIHDLSDTTVCFKKCPCKTWEQVD